MKKKLTRVDAVLVAHHGLASLVWVVHVISCGHTGHVQVALVVRATLVVWGALVVWVASVIPCGLAGCILVLVISGGFAGVVSSFGRCHHCPACCWYHLHRFWTRCCCGSHPSRLLVG